MMPAKSALRVVTFEHVVAQLLIHFQHFVFYFLDSAKLPVFALILVHISQVFL